MLLAILAFLMENHQEEDTRAFMGSLHLFLNTKNYLTQKQLDCVKKAQRSFLYNNDNIRWFQSETDEFLNSPETQSLITIIHDFNKKKDDF